MMLKELPKPDIPENIKQFKKVLKEMRKTSGLIVEYHQINAKILKARYDALIVEGFTPEQAIELCRQ